MVTNKELEEILKRYDIAQDGVVFSKPSRQRSKLLKWHLDKDGYPRYAINTSKRLTNIHVHRLLAYKFIPNPSNLPQVNHKDGVKLNFDLDNLEWVTCSENLRHAYSTGLKSARKGQTNPCALIDDTTVHLICSRYVPGMRLKDFWEVNKGLIKHSNLRNIFYGHNWRHIASIYGIKPFET